MFSVECPHCFLQVWIEEINCRIFRHAVYITTREPINPHASEEECNRLRSENLILGCGRPFMLNEKNEPVICGYI